MRSRFIAVAIAGLLALPLAAEAATYQIDPAHSSVEFTIRHLVARVTGRFTEFSGTIEFDESAPQQGKVSVVIKTASIDTDNDERDKHLRSADFFDVASYPEITFEGAGGQPAEDGFEAGGTLVIKDISREVVLPVELLGVGPDPWGHVRAGFYAELTLNRKDFGINWNKSLDQGGVILGDKVTVRITVEAMRTAE